MKKLLLILVTLSFIGCVAVSKKETPDKYTSGDIVVLKGLKDTIIIGRSLKDEMSNYDYQVNKVKDGHIVAGSLEIVEGYIDHKIDPLDLNN